MGCQPSIDRFENREHTQTVYDFALNYNQFIPKDRGDVFQFYHFSKVVSRSSTSIIRKVIHRVSKVQRICKIIPLTKKQCRFAMSQVQTLRKLDHPNIVQIHQYYFEGNFLYIIMENIPGIQILKYNIQNGGMTMEQIIKIMRQLISAVEYIHNKQYVHRNILPNNIMIVQSKQKMVKLIDFSKSSVYDCPAPPPPLKKDLPLLAPEINTCVTYQKKVDIWGCGLILYSLVSGTNPNQFAKDQKKLLSQLSAKDKKNTKVVQFLKKLTNPNNAQRPTAQQCLEDPFLHVSEADNKNRMPIMKNLMKFKIEDKLKSLLWMYASLNISNLDEKSQLMIEFQNLDKNGNGVLSFEELKVGVQNSFNITEEQAGKHVQQIFCSLDKNNNGYLQYSQFVMGTTTVTKIITEDTIKKMFLQIDINNNGKISEEELLNLIEGVDFEKLGIKGNQIDFCTFKKIMYSIIELQQTEKQ